MATVNYKRSNYLIDKPFQLGFIAKYILITLLTIIIVFLFAALYYYQDSILGTKKLDQNIIITKRTNQTPEGYKIYSYDKEQIIVYKDTTDGKIVVRVWDPINNTQYTKDDELKDFDQNLLNESNEYFITSTKVTKMFYIVIFPLFFVCITLICIISIYSLFFSHRMAGPIYRIRVSLDRMLAGDFDFKIRVRKNDYFLNIVEKLEQLRLKVKNNELATKMPKEKLLEIKALVDKKADISEIDKKLDDMLN